MAGDFEWVAGKANDDGIDAVDIALIRELLTLNIAELPDVAQLTERYRALLEVHELAHHDLNEMAQMLGIPLAQARLDYQQAIEALYGLLYDLIYAQSPSEQPEAESELAKLVRQRRLAAGLSQQDLAHLVGLNTSTILDLELGR